MHSVFVTVDIKAGRVNDATGILDAVVIPRAKQSPGFARGVWWHNQDETVGYGLITFDTAQNAEAMAAQGLDGPPDAPVTVRSVEVGTVHAEA